MPAPALEALERLPHPLHLLEFVGGAQHHHLGCFARPDERLRSAQDRMSTLGAAHFPSGARILDIGCGMGGTTRLLAQRGLHVLALDPCRAAVEYARERALARGADGRARYLAGRLQDLARTACAPLDGALALEVLQHFPDLSEFFACCRALLRPGAPLVLHDVATTAALEWTRAPFHRRGRVRDAARAAGFTPIELRNLVRDVLPSLPQLAGELEARRAALVAAFDRRGPHGDARLELGELLGQLGALQRAFERGEFVYELTVLIRGGARRGQGQP